MWGALGLRLQVLWPLRSLCAPAFELCGYPSGRAFRWLPVVFGLQERWQEAKGGRTGRGGPQCPPPLLGSSAVILVLGATTFPSCLQAWAGSGGY